MMRKYPVRFGGGPGEKAAMTSLAVYPTSSVAPAFGRARPLTGHDDNLFNRLHMNHGVRSTWPGLLSGTCEGGKPRDNSAATLSHTGVDRPDLIPMLTRGTCEDGP